MIYFYVRLFFILLVLNVCCFGKNLISDESYLASKFYFVFEKNIIKSENKKIRHEVHQIIYTS